MKCTVCGSHLVESRPSAAHRDSDVLEFCHDCGTCFCPACCFAFTPRPYRDLSTESGDNSQ